MPQCGAIDQWHKGRGFPKSRLGFYVGYHFVIENDGLLVRTRLDYEEGAHTIGENFRSLGICLVGNLDIDDPTHAQIETLGRLLSQLCVQYAIGADAIFPHRHFASKSCYGDRLPDDWAAIVYLQAEIERLTQILHHMTQP